MKKNVLLCLFFLLLNTSIVFCEMQTSAGKPVVVVLGANCQPAVMLQKFNLREAAYPFDWVINNSLDNVITCIKDRFAHWTDPAYLEYRSYIHNTFYEISFMHDFPKGEGPVLENFLTRDFLKYLPEVAEKYQRRTQRFLNLLDSDKPVIFIYSDMGTIESSYRFVHFVKSCYPHLNFLLVNIFQGDVTGEMKMEGPNWYIPNVRNFYAYRKNIWWEAEEWHNIYKELGIIDYEYGETQLYEFIDTD